MHIRYTFILLISLISCQTSAQQFNKKNLVGTWHYSVEEQNGDTLVFRPDGYELPRTRGREKMELQENNEFVYFQIAPTDGYLKLTGTFKIKNNNELLLVYDDTIVKANKHYIILFISDKKLMLKPVIEK